MGVGAHSDIIEFIKGKSLPLFPLEILRWLWYHYGETADGTVPVALIRMWLRPKPTHVFIMPLSCLRGLEEGYGSMWRDEVCSSEIRLQETINLPVCLYAIEIELEPWNERPFGVIFRSAQKCVVNTKHLEAVKKNSKHNNLCPQSWTFNWQSLANEIWKRRFWKLGADLCGSTSEEFDCKEAGGKKGHNECVLFLSRARRGLLCRWFLAGAPTLC